MQSGTKNCKSMEVEIHEIQVVLLTSLIGCVTVKLNQVGQKHLKRCLLSFSLKQNVLMTRRKFQRCNFHQLYLRFSVLWIFCFYF